MKQLQVAAKLEQCRDTAKRFFRGEYEAKLKPYTALLKAHMKQSGKDELHSVIELVQLDSISENGMAQMLFFSAAIELIEANN